MGTFVAGLSSTGTQAFTGLVYPGYDIVRLFSLGSQQPVEEGVGHFLEQVEAWEDPEYGEVQAPRPRDRLDFDGPFGIYAWELFLHVPLAIAARYRAAGELRRGAQMAAHGLRPAGRDRQGVGRVAAPAEARRGLARGRRSGSHRGGAARALPAGRHSPVSADHDRSGGCRVPPRDGGGPSPGQDVVRLGQEPVPRRGGRHVRALAARGLGRPQAGQGPPGGLPPPLQRGAARRLRAAGGTARQPAQLALDRRRAAERPAGGGGDRPRASCRWRCSRAARRPTPRPWPRGRFPTASTPRLPRRGMRSGT